MLVFPHLISFIRCANNNLASTVVEAFLQGVLVYGLPETVPSDHDPFCVITRNSVHNERIERMWRDVTRNISKCFIATFYELEAEKGQ